MNRTCLFAAASLAAAAPSPAFGCSSCGCNLTSDWLSQGLVTEAGTVVSLRYDYVPQTQLRAGRKVVDRSTIALPTDREIERYTYNHYATLTLDHAVSASWAFNLQLPFVYRPHATVAEDTVGISRSRTEGLGDIRATARYQHADAAGVTGIEFGLKLPTGRFRQDFRSGPAAGEEVDRGLQPGSGTVGAIIGAYRFGRLGGAFDYVLQALGEVPLDRRDGYRPGLAATASAGIRYGGWKSVTPQLQLNFRAAERDHGIAADRPDSGGEQLYLAPGLTAPLGARTSTFVFAQLPLYQRVEGYQLAPKYSLSFGVQRRF